jgi:D-alanyl-D-alanine carboxypeptidase/D-alanyl-D-alanine-endopeptidase (penicillin-binding protein 4)
MTRGPITPSRRRILAGIAGGAMVAGAGARAGAPAASLRPPARPSDRAAEEIRAPAAERLVAEARLGAGAKISYAVADAETGDILEARAPLLPQPPASVAKAVTALYALDALGGGFRFRTEALAAGRRAGGRIVGDLILAGTGDPTLQTNALAELAARVKAAGITEVTGDLLVWDGALPRIDRIDPGQPEHVGYNPAVSGLNLNFNRVHFEWRRAGSGYAVTMDARSNRYRPEVSVARMEVVARRAPVYTYSDGGDVDEWTVARAALGGGGARWLPVREPALYCGDVFRTFLRAQGIATGGLGRARRLPQAAMPVAEVRSGALRPMLADMLKYSTNVTAEALGLAASAASGRAPRDLPDSGARMGDWLGGAIGGRRPDFVDHSGLGDRSRVSASDMVRALVGLGPEAALEGLLKPIPMRDAGYRVMEGYPAEVLAKTGTLNFVSGLGGYLRPAGGRPLAFAIFAADLDRRAAIPKAQRERPEGARGWARRARILQMRLLDRWATLHA